MSSALTSERGEVLRELHELLDALDRRVPRMERAGEVEIADAAAALRAKALARIREIESVLPVEDHWA
jgi:hypothetical protein